MQSADPPSAVTSRDEDTARSGRQTGAGHPPADRIGASYGPLVRQSHAGWERIARRAAHQGLVAVGQPTHRARLLPSFLIVGAERCGTSSLYHVLRQHPAVFGSGIPRKEVHYFDLAYRHGLPWYQAHFPLKARARLAARGASAAPVAFEATPYYMFHPLAPERIARDLPGVKLLVLVRDPVQRAYSAYGLRIGRGVETESFERALELEDARLDGEADRMVADPSYVSHNHRHFAYRARGHYADQLEHMEKLFGRDRIHVEDSGEFFADPRPVYQRTLDFLGLPQRDYPDVATEKTRKREPMPETVRAALDEHYRPYDERLTVWLGHEPSWRRQAKPGEGR